MKKTRTDRCILLNPEEHPYIEHRIYAGGGCNPAITASHDSYGNWVLYEENDDIDTGT